MILLSFQRTNRTKLGTNRLCTNRTKKAENKKVKRMYAEYAPPSKEDWTHSLNEYAFFDVEALVEYLQDLKGDQENKQIDLVVGYVKWLAQEEPTSPSGLNSHLPDVTGDRVNRYFGAIFPKASMRS